MHIQLEAENDSGGRAIGSMMVVWAGTDVELDRLKEDLMAVGSGVIESFTVRLRLSNTDLNQRQHESD